MYLKVKNSSFDSDLVKRSASCSPVGIWWMYTRPYFTWDLKWWYFRAMCFVLGEKLDPVAILIHDWLPLCTFQTKFGFEMRRGNTSFISSIIIIRGNTCLSAEDNSTYSASDVVSSISVCRELRQNIGTVSVHDYHSGSRHEVVCVVCICFLPTSRKVSVYVTFQTFWGIGIVDYTFFSGMRQIWAEALNCFLVW